MPNLQLFLGIPIESDFQVAISKVSPSLLSAFIKEDDTYLQQVSHKQKIYLGKSIGIVSEFPQLELSEAHLRSLLAKLLPEYPVSSLSLYLFPYAT